MKPAIEKLLTSAELLFERGEIAMAKSALNEVLRRIGEERQDEDGEARIQDLTEKLESEGAHVMEAADTKTVLGHPRCHKCHGTGQYGHLGRCHSCLGKGWQDANDIQREKNYWARRERQAEEFRKRSKDTEWF